MRSLLFLFYFYLFLFVIYFILFYFRCALSTVFYFYCMIAMKVTTNIFMVMVIAKLMGQSQNINLLGSVRNVSFNLSIATSKQHQSKY